MIEQFLSRAVWYEVIKMVKARKDIPDEIIQHWIKSPVSLDYLEGCAVGILTYTDALMKSGRTDKEYVHWLAQKTASNLIFVLHERGFKPYGEVDKDFLDNFPTQSEIDEVVKNMLKQMGTEPPPLPEKK